MTREELRDGLSRLEETELLELLDLHSDEIVAAFWDAILEDEQRMAEYLESVK